MVLELRPLVPVLLPLLVLLSRLTRLLLVVALLVVLLLALRLLAVLAVLALLVLLVAPLLLPALGGSPSHPQSPLPWHSCALRLPPRLALSRQSLPRASTHSPNNTIAT